MLKKAPTLPVTAQQKNIQLYKTKVLATKITKQKVQKKDPFKGSLSPALNKKLERQMALID